ncbi:MAG: MFS transporter [Candidatus Bathyarchaeota archaeon]|nr:MFS transporter [Candidatus Bathyarchaeota archaeon]
MTDKGESLSTSQSRLIELSFLLARFSANFPAMITSLLLIDIGLSFSASVGVMSQIRTAASLMAIVIGLMISVISLRFEHRKLLLIGLGIYTVSSFLCSIAPDYLSLMLFYSINGMGGAITNPMNNTLVAAYFLPKKRNSVLGLMSASAASAYLFGIPLVYIVSSWGGWRSTFGILLLAFSLVTLATSIIALKPKPLTPQIKTQGGYSKSFKNILNNKSALACLISPSLGTAAWTAIIVFSASFRRQRFLLATNFVTILTMGAALCFIISSRAREQVPEFRSTMMSLYSFSDSVGATLGAGIGGLILISYNYEELVAVLGAMGILSSIILWKYAVDPLKTS